MLPMMALFFILDMSLAMMMSLLPVVVMKMSAVDRTSSMGATVNPSMHACRAQMGSICRAEGVSARLQTRNDGHSELHDGDFLGNL